MKKEIFVIIAYIILMTIDYIITEKITGKELQVGLLIAMIIAFAVTRVVLFIIKNKKK